MTKQIKTFPVDNTKYNTKKEATTACNRIKQADQNGKYKVVESAGMKWAIVKTAMVKVHEFSIGGVYTYTFNPKNEVGVAQFAWVKKHSGESCVVVGYLTVDPDREDAEDSLQIVFGNNGGWGSRIAWACPDELVATNGYVQQVSWEGKGVNVMPDLSDHPVCTNAKRK
jgi:hypothetical protein